MPLNQMILESSSILASFDPNQNDLDDGDQTDTLNTIRSPHKHDYVQAGEESDSDSNSDSDEDQQSQTAADVNIRTKARKVEELSKDFGGFEAGLHGFV